MTRQILSGVSTPQKDDPLRIFRGQSEVAAAGGHHVALIGPPGAGKTMLAERMPSILPELDDEAALEVTALHSIAGTLPPGGGLLRRPPFQAPHHTATVQSLVGGGSGLAKPGAISLAHRGVLFLDEAPEFSGRALDALRQPLESGRVLLRRVAALVGEAGYRVGNLDATVIAQAPKLAPHIAAMVANIAADLAVEARAVNVKATTSERLGFTGRGEGIAAEAVVLLWRREPASD